MSEKKIRNVTPVKLELDENNKYIINLPNGEHIAVELNEKEIFTVENWLFLFSKHNLRYDIWNILQIYSEANITQISNMVKQSKSTVARHLKSMEEDGLILSRKADKSQKGKIPPILFRINRKLLQVCENSPVNKLPPEDPSELLEFYKKEIQKYRGVIYRYKLLLDSLNPLLDDFEKHLKDKNAAKKIYDKYLNITKLEPWFAYYYFSEKYYDQFMDEFIKFIQKGSELLAIQNNDPEVKERGYTYITAILPIKALVEFYRQKLKEE